MKEHANKPEVQSRTLDSNSKSSRQAPISEILQRFRNNTGMPDNLKNGIEELSGFSMDDVRVHYNSSEPAQLQALAYAQGTDIHIAPGQEQCLPHEAWHVVQQKQGRVQPTLQLQGMNVNDDDALEREADVMGHKSSLVQRTLKTTNLVGNQLTHQKCIQREELEPTGFLDGSINYTTKLNRGRKSAWKMNAYNIKFPSYRHFQLTPGNSPSADPPGWYLGFGYVRMHLLNAQLGGRGDDIKNLAIGSQALNSLHKNEVEKKLLSHVRDKRGTINDYSVECTYNTGQGDLDYSLKQINCKYHLSDGSSDDVNLVD